MGTTTRDTKDNKKKVLALALLGFSAIGLVGLSVAYFSDVIGSAPRLPYSSLWINGVSI